MNRYLTAMLIALSATSQAQSLQPAPKLVVNITIDQLRTDYLEAFSPLYGQDGFKKLMAQGRVYEGGSYSFTPIDRASAAASIVTGTSPYYNGIVSCQWLDRNTLRPVGCVDDSKYQSSPNRLSTSTVGDELKVATNGQGIVYSLGTSRDAAVLCAGHAADGAVWIDDKSGMLTTSTYYGDKTAKWLNAYKTVYSQAAQDDGTRNLAIVQAAKDCVSSHAMGRDDATDLLYVTLSAKGRNAFNWQKDMESVYLKLDKAIGSLVSDVESTVGKQNVMFVVTSTGYTDEDIVDYKKYRIPSGTFYINRTANLMNIYLGAIYGQGGYVETCFHNQIYLNRKLLEQKRISLSEILSRCQEFLILNAGVRDVYTTTRLLSGNSDTQKIRNGHNPAISGDIMIEVAPGWQLYNEDNQEKQISRASFVPFPIIFYGAGISKGERISTPITVDRLAPTIAKSIRIRAPNACKAEPLF